MEVSCFKLVIPKIDLNYDIYNLGNGLNNVDYNIELLSDSNIEENIYFLAGHSGNGDNCYFNRIKELEIGDVIYIYIDDKELVYEVEQIYFIRKNGYMEVDDINKNVLYLITCSGYNRQLIVKGVLIN